MKRNGNGTREDCRRELLLRSNKVGWMDLTREFVVVRLRVKPKVLARAVTDK